MKKITIKGFQRKLQIPSEFESGSIIFSSVDMKMPKRSVLKGGSAQYYKLTKAHDDGYIDLQVIQFLKVPFLVIGTCDSQCHLSC